MAVGASVMAIIKMSGRKDVKIVDDPARSDYGDVIMGTQRFNIWAGYQPIVRTAYQWLYNEKVPSGGGTPYRPGRVDVAWNFMRSKLHPTYNLVSQYAPIAWGDRPKTFTGDPIEASFAGVTKEVREHMAMLFWQDLADALKNEGFMGLTALVGNFGVGVQSYKTPPRATRPRSPFPPVPERAPYPAPGMVKPKKPPLFRLPGSRFETVPGTGKERVKREFLK